jgi:hypothetical protein
VVGNGVLTWWKAVAMLPRSFFAGQMTFCLKSLMHANNIALTYNSILFEDDEQQIPSGYQYMEWHLVFDVKLDGSSIKQGW